MSATINIPPPGTYAPPSITDYLQSPSIGMQPRNQGGETFDQVLQQAMLPANAKITFSQQAQERMEARGIKLSPDDMVNLSEAVNQANAKGADQAFVMLKGNTFVVDIKSGSVVNVYNQNESRANLTVPPNTAVLRL